ncbi:hypothetical protein Scep_000706 [Stephania cephalantha]|uniref:GATA-type domain-containing protein n=1 Tax=Stephania cephalantha TaxID=152367 RepID=A0AAP0L7M4_9MAGN
MSSYPFDEVFDHHHHHQYLHHHGYQSPPASSAVVDCTLSLGTPSTRHIDYEKAIGSTHSGRSSKSNLCWDLFHQSGNKRSSCSSSSSTSSSCSSLKSRGSGTSSSTVLNNLNGDPLLARRCANCDTTSTPLWRNGPRGPKSLCNACGIRYKKEERRATNNGTANITAGTTTTTTMDHHHQHEYQYYSSSSSSWAPHHHHMRVPSNVSSGSLGNEFRFVEDDDHRSSDSSIPFLSWRLNVSDNRHSGLVHDYT